MYKVLLVGLGQIAMGYDLETSRSNAVLSHARGFSLHPDFKLVGGVDPQQKLCTLFTKHFTASASSDLRAMVAETDPDIVVISSPTSEHGACLKTILDCCVPKLILCEKPLSYDLEEARYMVKACEHKGCLLFVNYLRRVDPAVIEVKKRFDNKDIQFPIKGAAWYTKGLMHNGSHFVNLLEHWLGPVIESRVTSGGAVFEDGDWEPCFDLMFENGAVHFQPALGAYYSHHDIHLLAANGCLRYEQGGTKITWQDAMPSEINEGYNVLSSETETLDTGGCRPLLYMVDAVSKCLNNEDSALCSGNDGLATIELLVQMRANQKI